MTKPRNRPARASGQLSGLVLTQQGDVPGRIGGAVVLDEGVISLVDPSRRCHAQLVAVTG